MSSATSMALGPFRPNYQDIKVIVIYPMNESHLSNGYKDMAQDRQKVAFAL